VIFILPFDGKEEKHIKKGYRGYRVKVITDYKLKSLFRENLLISY